MKLLAQAKLGQSPTEFTQPTTEGVPVEVLFEKQRAYFATDVTKSYEWRIDQLDRLIRMLKNNFERFSDAVLKDFKTATQENVFEVLKLLVPQAAISLENTRLYRGLEAREAKIQSLVDANIIGIHIWNLEGEIIEANEAFLRMLGYSRADLISGGMTWAELTPAEWSERDQRAKEELMTTGVFQPFEKEYFRKDGSRVPVLIGGAVFKGGGNEGVSFVLDLSEQKRADEALQTA
jgi:PAS domain S-box-containing protein